MPDIVWDTCYGAIETLTPGLIPDGYATSAINVDLTPVGLMRPRPGHVGWIPGFTGGPSTAIENAFVDRSDVTYERLWVFSVNAGTVAAHTSDDGGGWVSRTLIDTPVQNLQTPINVQAVACVYNGKTYLAYDSSVNRLHLWDGTSVRRVGVEAPVAATVANTGGGAYAATLRYYKIQMRLVAGTNEVWSELGASVSFTPSGAGTAARVTKPATTDGATHWVVYASADDVSYYDISGVIAVGTTTYDDSTAPSSYNSGTIAEEPGKYVPPPSCRFLASNGERLFMAGAFESSATSLQTTPSRRRVWFTRPLGATDQGDDETVTQTAASRYWVDLDNDDGSQITGLVSAIDGSMYVSTGTSLWRLTDTGSAEAPIAAERVVSGRGPTSHYHMTVSDAADGSFLYFSSSDGPYRYSPATGLQYLGADVVAPTAGDNTLGKWDVSCVQWDAQMRRVVWLLGGLDDAVYGRMRLLHTSFLTKMFGELRGGWTLNYIQVPNPRFKALVMHQGQLNVAGGNSSNAPRIYIRDDTDESDDGSQYVSSITSKSWRPGDTRNFSTEDMYVFKRRSQSLSLSMSRNRGGTENTITDTISAETPGGSESIWHRIKVEGLVLADAASMELTISTTQPVANRNERHLDGVESVVIPYTLQELG